MKWLRALVMILLLLTLSAGSTFASDADDVEVYSSASLESTQLAAAPGITPYTADYELSVVRGENSKFRANIVGGGNNFGWIKIRSTKQNDTATYPSVKINLSKYSSSKVTTVNWSAATSNLKLGTYELQFYVGNSSGTPVSGATVYTIPFSVVSQRIPLNSLSFYAVPGGSYDQSKVTAVSSVALCPGTSGDYGVLFQPLNVSGYRYVSFSSSDTSVASVTDGGGVAHVSALKDGTAVITVTAVRKSVSGADADTVTASLTVTVGHSYVSKNEVKATCVSTGSGDYTCTRCGKTYHADYPIDPNAHNFGSNQATVVAAPTATQSGKSTNHCTLCNQDITYDTAPIFEDCPQQYYRDAIDYFYAKQYVNGMNSTHFSPATPLTRGMVVTILYRMEGSPGVQSQSPFTDVPSGKYYSDAVFWAYQNGIVLGTGKNTFLPNNPILRQDLAVILLRYAKYQGITPDLSGDLSKFADADQVRLYAKDAISFCTKEEIIRGVQSGDMLYIQPLNSTRRGEAVTMLYRYIQSFSGKETQQPADAVEALEGSSATLYMPQSGVVLCAAPKVTLPYGMDGQFDMSRNAFMSWLAELYRWFTGTDFSYAAPKVTSFSAPQYSLTLPGNVSKCAAPKVTLPYGMDGQFDMSRNAFMSWLAELYRWFTGTDFSYAAPKVTSFPGAESRSYFV